MWLEPSFHGLQWPYMAKSGVGVSGSAWVDNSYETITRGPATPNTTRWLQQGRAVLRVTPTYTSGRFFIQAQAELVANECQTDSPDCQQAKAFNTDDMWLRVGHWKVWDLKVGRFEGWELYHTGMGLDINTLERLGAQKTDKGVNPALPVPDYYGASFLQYRRTGLGIGYAALHWYPLDYLRFELLTELGTNQSTSTGKNYLGGRPAGILDLGWMKLKAGGEYEVESNGTQETASITDSNGNSVTQKRYDKYKQTRKGVGVGLQFLFNPWVEFGANFGWGSQTAKTASGSSDAPNSWNVTCIGGFANFRLGRPGSLLEDLTVGAGANWTTQYDSLYVGGDKNPDYSAHLQTFGAVQYLIAKQLYVKAVLAYARSDFQPSGATAESTTSNEMWSGRVRLMYLY
jgi:hypothetical protein